MLWNTKDVRIEHTRKDKQNHCCIRKFVGIHNRVWKDDNSPRKMYLDQATPTSIPKKVWAIARARAKRNGQLELLSTRKTV